MLCSVSTAMQKAHQHGPAFLSTGLHKLAPTKRKIFAAEAVEVDPGALGFIPACDADSLKRETLKFLSTPFGSSIQVVSAAESWFCLGGWGLYYNKIHEPSNIPKIFSWARDVKDMACRLNLVHGIVSSDTHCSWRDHEFEGGSLLHSHVQSPTGNAFQQQRGK